MRWYADWLRYQIEKLGVEVHLRHALNIDTLRQFEVVLIATGGRLFRPAIPGVDLPLVVTFEDVLRCATKGCEYYPQDKPPPVECGQTVLVWGDHFAAADAAERLAADGRKVFVVTEKRSFAQWMEPCHRDVLLKRFAGGNGEGLPGRPFAQPVTVIANTTVTEIRADGEVLLMDAEFNRSVLRVDNVVLAGVEPQAELYQQLLEAGITAACIGDALRVRNLRAAVTEGANFSLTLEGDAILNANRAIVSRSAAAPV
jgi:thioredoxin reductase